DRVKRRLASVDSEEDGVLRFRREFDLEPDRFAVPELRLGLPLLVESRERGRDERFIVGRGGLSIREGGSGGNSGEEHRGSPSVNTNQPRGYRTPRNDCATNMRTAVRGPTNAASQGFFALASNSLMYFSGSALNSSRQPVQHTQ